MYVLTSEIRMYYSDAVKKVWTRIWNFSEKITHFCFKLAFYESWFLYWLENIPTKYIIIYINRLIIHCYDPSRLIMHEVYFLLFSIIRIIIFIIRITYRVYNIGPYFIFVFVKSEMSLCVLDRTRLSRTSVYLIIYIEKNISTYCILPYFYSLYI